MRGRFAVVSGAWEFITKAGKAALYASPVAQLLLEDLIAAALYLKWTNGHYWSPGTAGVAAALLIENVLLCSAIAQLPSLRKVERDRDDRRTAILAKPFSIDDPLHALRRLGLLLLDALKWPFVAVGQRLEKAGKRLEYNRGGVVKKIGRLIFDTGAVNALGTAPVVAGRLANHEKVPKRDIYRLSLLFTTSWMIAVAPALSGVKIAADAMAPLRKPIELFDSIPLGFKWAIVIVVVVALYARGFQALGAAEAPVDKRKGRRIALGLSKLNLH